MKRYRYLDERKFHYFCQGLTLDSKDMEVLDKVLCDLDRKNKMPSRIMAHNQSKGFGPPPRFTGPQIIANVEKYSSPEKGPLSLSTVVTNSADLGAAPAIHVYLRSPTLDIPQRVEIPMRYLLKGLPAIENTYMVYLHALTMESGETYVYYGLTKRGWMKRFNDHMTSALREHSHLLFHRTLREGILGRLVQLRGAESIDLGGDSPPKRIMTGNHHVVCVAGIDEEQALQTEQYLVEKYSFGHPLGLNMTPGGRAGIAYLHQLKVSPDDRPLVLDEDRERILESYLKDHPRKGIPNPLIAAHWEDDDYAARIICGGVHRLTVQQV